MPPRSSRTGIRFETKRSDKLENISSREARELIVTLALPIIEANWRAVAKRKLSKRRAAIYVEAINVSSFRGSSASLILSGTAANNIEFGADAWDMKPGLLAGKSSRVIAFEHASHRAKGKFGQPMGSPYRRDFGDEAADAIGRKVYDRAKKLVGGARMIDAPAPLLRPHHKTNIYEGMQRIYESKRGAGIAATGYRTFRTVSNRSPANSWIYPAQPAANVIDEAIAESTPQIQAAVSRALGGIIVKVKKGQSPK